MATKTKDKGKRKERGFHINRVTNKAQRAKGSRAFLYLKDQESMKAIALFKPEPDPKENPFATYYEYYEHYDETNRQYVPCVGQDCYMCELGDSPSQRALTVWYFPDNDAADRIKVFKLNGWLINDFAEIEEEEGGVLGFKFRVKRTSKQGKYRVSKQSDKKTPDKEIKALVADAPDLEELVLKDARRAWEKFQAAEAMEDVDDDADDDTDDDDEEEDTKKSARKGKAKSDKKDSKSKKDDDEDEDDDEDDEDDNSDDDDEDEDDDDASDDSDDDDDDDEDEDEDSDESDSDDDDESDDEDSDDDDDDSEDEGLKGEKFSVESTNEEEESITVKYQGKKTKLWINDGLEVDWEKLTKGTEFTVDASKDDEDDWIVTKIKVGKPKADAKKDKGGKGKKAKK